MGIIEGATSEVFKYIADQNLISPGFATFWIITRALFVSVSAFLLFMIIFLLVKNDYTHLRFADIRSELYKKRPKYALEVKERWEEVKEHIENGKEIERRLGIIEADDVLKETLDYFGYKGDDLLDKLILLTEAIIPNIEGVKNSHKRVREIFHNPNIDLSKEEAKGIFSIYEVVLKDMEVI